MSKVVIWSRSFNAFISTMVSAWSVGIILIPLLLNLIIAGFFGFFVTIPLLAICIIAGAIAIGVGIWSGYSRYCHLTTAAKELASKYRLAVIEITSDTPIDIEKIFQEPSNTITLVLDENKKTVTAYFKSAEHLRLSFDLVLSPIEQTQLLASIGAKNKTESDKEIINKTIQDILTNQAHTVKDKGDDDSKKTKSEEQNHLLLWEKINAFFCDAPTIFALSLIVIFLISHFFLGILIPSALLIAVAVSIAYGLFSALIKDKQCDAKLRAMNTLESSYEAVVKMAHTLIVDVNACMDRINYLKKYAEEISPDDLVNTATTLANEIATLRTQVSTPHGQLIAIKAEAHLELSNKDKWRLIYAFVSGGITLGSCIYVILPTLLTLLGLAPLSLPVFAVIIGVASILYALCSFYNKKQMIERENWNKMDNEAIEKIRLDVTNEQKRETKEIQTTQSSLANINASLTKLKQDLELVAKNKAATEHASQPASSEADFSSADLDLATRARLWLYGVGKPTANSDALLLKTFRSPFPSTAKQNPEQQELLADSSEENSDEDENHKQLK